MPVYTGNGDDGETRLLGGERVPKDSPRIEAYGSVDEVNAILGRVRPTGHGDIDAVTESIQNHLHIVQAELAMPNGNDQTPTIETSHISEIETWIDEYEEEIGGLDSFVIPGGTDTGATLHHARSVCRRAERRVVSLASTDGENVREQLLTYVNRLSDALYILARTVNQREEKGELEPSY